MTQFKDLVQQRHYINGRWQQSHNDQSLTVLDKYSGEKLAVIPLATQAQADEALVAAQQAFSVFKSWSAGKRSAQLTKLASLIRSHADSLAELIVHEAGKPLGYARNEIERSIITVETAAAEALRFAGETVPLDFAAGEGKTAFTKRFPVGPVVGITPFNFPLNLVLHKVAPALAVGCPIVLKPAPQAPLTALALASLIDQLDYPPGVFNVLLCNNEVAESMVTSPIAAMFSFTGSAKVGWYLKSKVNEKKVALELGGNAAVIIDDSADLETAAKLTARGAYLYAGQVCISVQRIYVLESVYDRFTNLLLNEIRQLKTGDPADPEVSVGPIIDQGHFERISDWVSEAVNGGAELLIGGEPVDAAHHLYAPTLLTHTKRDMKVNCEEVFGPVAVIEKVKDFQEGLDRVNDSDYGLQAGVFTNAFDHVKEAHDQLVVGGIMINNIPGFRVDSMPYGGVKNSGFGREGLRYAMEEMTEGRLLVF